MKKEDIVCEILTSLHHASPRSSYRRLNSALGSTLYDCMAAGLPFRLKTFQDIYHHCNGGYWFGDGSGSHTGEHYYSSACELGHASAQQSFEYWADRPPVLWENNIKTATRLHVGERFAWQGRWVTVTSMRKDSLVACTYWDTPSEVEGFKVGATIGYNTKHLITKSQKEGKATVLRLVPAPNGHGERQVRKRFIITYKEIQDYRSKAAAKLRAMLKRIKTGKKKDIPAIAKAINAAKFRHWELEEINAAFKKAEAAREQKRKDAKDKRAAIEWKKGAPARAAAAAKAVEDWKNGRGENWCPTEETLLRIKEDQVECSNGNAVSVAAARRVLPVLLDQRNQEQAMALPIDQYEVKHIYKDSVEVGCTLVPWSEIDRIAPALLAEPEKEKTVTE